MYTTTKYALKMNSKPAQSAQSVQSAQFQLKAVGRGGTVFDLNSPTLRDNLRLHFENGGNPVTLSLSFPSGKHMTLCFVGHPDDPTYEECFYMWLHEFLEKDLDLSGEFVGRNKFGRNDVALWRWNSKETYEYLLEFSRSGRDDFTNGRRSHHVSYFPDNEGPFFDSLRALPWMDEDDLHNY